MARPDRRATAMQCGSSSSDDAPAPIFPRSPAGFLFYPDFSADNFFANGHPLRFSFVCPFQGSRADGGRTIGLTFDIRRFGKTAVAASGSATAGVRTSSASATVRRTLSDGGFRVASRVTSVSIAQHPKPTFCSPPQMQHHDGLALPTLLARLVLARAVPTSSPCISKVRAWLCRELTDQQSNNPFVSPPNFQ